MAADLPVRISIFQQPKEITGYQKRLAAHLRAVDYTDASAALASAEALHREERLDGVVSFTEYGLGPAALITEALGIAGNNPRAVFLNRDKLAMRERLQAAGLPAVRFRRCASTRELRDFQRRIGGPVIIKPAQGSGSAGVLLIRGEGEAAGAFRDSRRGHRGPSIAEEFLAGQELSVETFTRDGVHEALAVTEKVTTGAPRFVETGHQMPARLTASELKAVKSAAIGLLEAIGQSLGPAHIEVMRTAGGVRIIEGNTRPGGDFIWEMVLHVTGVDLVRETLRAMMGAPAGRRTRRAAAGAVRFLAHENAVVRRAPGPKARAGRRGIIRCHCALTRGQVLGPLRSSDDRHGVIVATGKDVDDAVRKAEAGVKALGIEVRVFAP